MRAYEFLNPDQPPITLRHLNQLKHRQQRKEQAEVKRAKLMPLMYSNPDDFFEYKKNRLELATLQAKYQEALAKAENEKSKHLHDMAADGIKAQQTTDSKITGMAMAGLGRRKKCPTD